MMVDPIALGASVYHRATTDRCRGLVTGRLLEPGGELIRVCWGDTRTVSWHYPLELSTVYVPNFKDGQ